MGPIGVISFGIAAGLCFLPTAALAGEPARTVLATGDAVPGFGSIGSRGFATLAATNDGRLIVTASLSDGRSGVFFVENRQLVTIVTSDQQPGIELALVSAHPDGTVMVPVRGPGWPRRYTLHVFKSDGTTAIIQPPSSDVAGNQFCWVDPHNAKVNSSGEVAFRAEIAPRGGSCEHGDRVSAIYLARGAEVEPILESTDTARLGPSCRYLDVVELLVDTTVIATCSTSIVAVNAAGVRRIVGDGDLGASGKPLALQPGVVANSNGDIAFRAAEDGSERLYRTEGHALIEASSSLVSPNGTNYDDVAVAALNPTGDVFVYGRWSDSDDSWPREGIALYPASGEQSIIFHAGSENGLGRYTGTNGNVRADPLGGVTYEVWAVDGSSSLTAFRRSQEGTIETLLASGDAGPDGTVIAAGGLDWQQSQRCLAPDGRMAIIAESTTGHTGIVCVDAGGPHLLLESGTADPDGYALNDFLNCTFTDDGAIVFAGERAISRYGDDRLFVDTGVYRLGGDGLTKLFNDGDRVTNGTVITDQSSGAEFVANERGAVLARSRAGNDFGLFIRRDGRLDVVTFNPGVQWGLTDNDDVVLLQRLDSWRPPDWPVDRSPAGNAIVVWRDLRSRVVLRSSSTLFGQSHFNRFTNMMVDGDLVFFKLGGDVGYDDRFFFYSLSDETLREVPISAGATIIAISAGGRVLEAIANEYAVIEANGDRKVVDRETADLEPFGLNDAGNIGLYSYAHPPESTQQVYQLTGAPPAASARCPQPGPPSTVVPSPTPTPEPISGSSPYRLYAVERFADVLTVIDTDTDEILRSVPISHRPWAVAVSPDGSRVFVGADAAVDVLDATTLQVIHSIRVGDVVNRILPSSDNLSALAIAPWSRFGGSRLLSLDGVDGLVSSALAPSAQYFGLGSDSTVLASRIDGGPCASRSTLLEIDVSDGTIARHVDLGTAIYGAAVRGTRIYALDGCDNTVHVLDVETLAVTATLPVAQNGLSFRIGLDGRGYATHGYASYQTNPEGSHTELTGVLSVLDFETGTVQVVPVPGGTTDDVAATPDGQVVYATAGGSVVAIDGNTFETRARVRLNAASAIVIGPAPNGALPTPATATPRVIVRAESASGVPSDEIDIAVSLDTRGLAVSTVEHMLLTSYNSPLFALRADEPDCRLEEGVDAVATFEFSSHCGAYSCDRVRVRITAAPGTSLPSGGPLYRCSARLTNHYFGSGPTLIQGVRATGVDGEQLPARGADGEVFVLSRDDATPLPTRTRPPTYTGTPTATPTPTPLPVSLGIGSITVIVGEVGVFDVVLNAHGASVAATQNDIAFAPGAPIAVASGGRPACSVNPAINKPDSVFGFQPHGCDATAGECTGVRVLVLSYQGVDIIPDGSVLYSCTIDGAVPGTFALSGENVTVSDPRGRRLAAVSNVGTVTVDERIPELPTPTASPSLPTQAAKPPGEPETPVATGVTGGASGSSDGMGCHVSAKSNSSEWLILLTAAFVVTLRMARRRVGP